MIISEAFALYLIHLKEEGYTTTHIHTVRSRLHGALHGRFAEPLTAVAHSDLRTYLYELVETGGLAEATAAGHAASLKAFFNWCVGEGLLAESPAVRLKKRSYKTGATPPGAGGACEQGGGGAGRVCPAGEGTAQSA